MDTHSEKGTKTGEIIRLRFSSHSDASKKDVKPSDSGLQSFEVMINPESINRVLSVSKSNNSSSKSSSGGEPVKCSPEKISFDFILDGTNVVVNQKGVSVKDHLDTFLSIVYKKGDKPIQVVIIEYVGTYFIVQTESINITYNLFDKDGKPLRAKVNCSFSTIEAESPKKTPTSTKTPNKKSELCVCDCNSNNITQHENTLYSKKSSNSSGYTNNTSQACSTARTNNLNSIKENTNGKKLKYTSNETNYSSSNNFTPKV